MKRIFLIAFVLSEVIVCKAQITKTMTVTNADQLVDAIGSDREIILKDGTYYISDVSSIKSSDYYRFDAAFDGAELVITGVNNLTIKCKGTKPAKVITKPKYGNVMVFENCSNIKIENIEAGHGPEKGYCTGGVIRLTNTKNMTIKNSILFGSGIEGIAATESSNLKVVSTTIKGCSNSILSLSKCNEIEFDSCEFTENKEFSLINIDNCINVTLKACNINNNLTTSSDYSTDCLFYITQSMGVLLENCIIENNATQYFCNSSTAMTMKDTKLENNSFRKGNFIQ